MEGNPTKVQPAKILDDWCRSVCAAPSKKPRGRMTMTKLAALIGVSKVQLYKWRHGWCRPKAEFWPIIEQLSGGRVPASLWKEPAKRKRLRPLKVAA